MAELFGEDLEVTLATLTVEEIRDRFKRGSYAESAMAKVQKNRIQCFALVAELIQEVVSAKVWKEWTDEVEKK